MTVEWFYIDGNGMASSKEVRSLREVEMVFDRVGLEVVCNVSKAEK